MKNQIDQTLLRTRQYWHVDGLAELGYASVCLILGLYFFAQATLPEESLLYQILDVGFVLVIIGSFLLAKKAIEALKRRLTYPRTGYVAFADPPPNRRWLSAIISLVGAAALAAAISAAPETIAWMPLITGLALAAVWTFMAARLALPRFYLLGLAALLLGIAAGFSALPNLLGLAIVYGLMALALFISGGLTLRAYLRSSSSTLETQS